VTQWRGHEQLVQAPHHRLGDLIETLKRRQCANRRPTLSTRRAERLKRSQESHLDLREDSFFRLEAYDDDTSGRAELADRNLLAAMCQKPACKCEGSDDHQEGGRICEAV
jgi:hypothetical protein